MTFFNFLQTFMQLYSGPYYIVRININFVTNTSKQYKMKSVTRLFAFFALLITTTCAFAQNQQEEKQKTPVEMAAMQADKFQTDFGLTDGQTFQIDSVLQVNLTGLYGEFDKMKAGGVQSSENYRAVQEKWMRKTEDAFRKIMTPDQFLRYEKITGQYAKRMKAEKDKAKEKAKQEKEMQKKKEN